MPTLWALDGDVGLVSGTETEILTFRNNKVETSLRLFDSIYDSIYDYDTIITIDQLATDMKIRCSVIGNIQKNGTVATATTASYLNLALVKTKHCYRIH